MQSEQAVQQAARILRDGGLVALPTETVYGLAADASNELAVRRIYAVKGRPASHPLIVHIDDPSALPQWARVIPSEAWKLANAFWPGALTLVLRRTPRASDIVTGGQETVAVRVPSHPLAREVLKALGGGVAAPSANRFGKVSPTTAEHVRADLGEDVDLILDGGPCTVGVESTIVDVTGESPAILRPGGIAQEEIEKVLGRPVPVRTGDSSTGVRAPGTLASHYAPRAGLELCAPERLFARAQELLAEGRSVGVIAPAKVELPAVARHYRAPPDDAGFARSLYALLRIADEAGHDILLAATPEPRGLGLALLDRLRRASAPR